MIQLHGICFGLVKSLVSGAAPGLESDANSLSEGGFAIARISMNSFYCPVIRHRY
jgi:hypothetical protein